MPLSCAQLIVFPGRGILSVRGWTGRERVLSQCSFTGRKNRKKGGTSRVHAEKVCLKGVCQQLREVHYSRKSKHNKGKSPRTSIPAELEYPYYFRTVSVLFPHYFRTISVRDTEWISRCAFYNPDEDSVRFPGSARIVYSHTADLHSLLHQFHELGEAVHDSVPHLLRSDPREEFPRAFDLRFFDLAELHGRHRPLRFGHEVDMLDGTAPKSDRPVGGVSAHRRGD